MQLSVVVPCFNEEEVLQMFYQKMLSAIKEARIYDYEIILIDDGSSDNSWKIISSLHQSDTSVKGIKLSRNFGHQAALTAGLQEARGELILIIDADLQDPPDLLKEMIELSSSGFDVVYGKRKSRTGESFFKLLSAKMFYRF